MENFNTELKNLINKYSLENNSNTPDWVLANFISQVLASFNVTIWEREFWSEESKKQTSLSFEEPTKMDKEPAIYEKFASEQAYEEHLCEKFMGEEAENKGDCDLKKSDTAKKSTNMDLADMASIMRDGFVHGAVVKLVDCWDTKFGYGILTGKMRPTVDGYLLEMSDGRESLFAYCTLVEDVNKDAEAFRYVYEETVKIQRRAEEFVNKVLLKNNFGKVD